MAHFLIAIPISFVLSSIRKGEPVTPEQQIEEIIRILNLGGEEATDGECLDMVAEFLTKNGWTVFG
jgi:hypothetical protein